LGDARQLSAIPLGGAESNVKVFRMESLIKVFDSILTLLVAFPVTIFYVLTSPANVIGTELSTIIIPPGATLFVSFIIWYLSHTVDIKIKYAHDLPAAPSRTFIIRVFIIIIFMLQAQYLLLLIPSLAPTQQFDAVTTMKALSYPVSASMAIYGILYLIYILFPLGSKPHGMAFQEIVDRNYYKVRKESNLKRIVVLDNASFLAICSAMLVYIYTLYNILRVLLNLSYLQAFHYAHYC
jgi:hypothetical protein